jgi:hypothetical protein
MITLATAVCDGTQSGDVTSFGKMTRESIGGLSIMKDPTAGSWINLTALPRFGSPTGEFGYLTLGDAASSETKYRLILTDHPSGG